jgi:hypothetical protein
MSISVFSKIKSTSNMISLFFQTPDWSCDEFFQKLDRSSDMSSPRSSSQIQKYGGFVVCCRLAALSVLEKRFRTTHVVAWLWREFTMPCAYVFYVLQKREKCR